jgi:hypothetical protein
MQSEDEKLTTLRTAIAKGEVQLDRGEGREYTPELMEKITQTARKNLHSGKPMDPDVIS